jgi:hypothetical protein
VQHDEDRSAEITRQVGYDGADRFNAASRGANYDDIVSGHGRVRASFVPPLRAVLGFCNQQLDLTIVDVDDIIENSTG